MRLLDDPQPQLALVSELAAGERLSTVLRAATPAGSRLDPTCAIWLLRQLLPALAAFHEATGGAQHRLLDADRVVLTPTGGLAITEYVFGGLAEDLLPAPRTTDLGQSALLAIAILRGRCCGLMSTGAAYERLVEPPARHLPGPMCSGPGSRARCPWGRIGSHRRARPIMRSTSCCPAFGGVVRRRRGEAEVSRPMPAPLAPAPRRRLWQLALPPAPAHADSVARRLWRVNRTLVAVATVEAVCIVALIRARCRARRLPNGLVARTNRAALGLSMPEALPLGPPVAVTLPPEAAALLISTDSAESGGSPESVTGWLVIESTAQVKVYVNGRLLGLATRRRFAVPAGEHLVTLASDASGFRSSQTIRIAAGRAVLVAPRPNPTMTTTITANPDRRFFMTMALVIAVIVFGGFAPTYYLRALYHTEPLPSVFKIHGFVFTAWVLLLVVQTSLVSARRTRHSPPTGTGPEAHWRC